MYKRPSLYTSYESETQILPTWTQKALMAFFIVQLFLLPFEDAAAPAGRVPSSLSDTRLLTPLSALSAHF